MWLKTMARIYRAAMNAMTKNRENKDALLDDEQANQGVVVFPEDLAEGVSFFLGSDDEQANQGVVVFPEDLAEGVSFFLESDDEQMNQSVEEEESK